MPHIFVLFGRLRPPLGSFLLGGALCLWLLSSASVSYAVTNLVWSDEFNGSSSNLDSTKWTFDTGNDCPGNCGWGNDELETYTSRTNNAYVANGLLHIVALNDQGGSYPYSSARVKTQGLFSFTYGRVEFHAKLPAKGPYWWPACWLLGTNSPSVGWPECGEMDVMESQGGTPDEVWGTIHKDSSGDKGVDSPVGSEFYFPTGDGTTNFHTYVLQWGVNTAGNSATISFGVDTNAPYETITNWSSSLGSYPEPFNQPFYIIMNMAVGGTFVGSPSTGTVNSSSTFPSEMDIDYVRVYQDVPLFVVKSMTPSNGCPNGGTPITITGVNFMSNVTVTVGGVSATSVAFVNTNTITAVTPANSPGQATVSVTIPYISPAGTNSYSGNLVNAFTYTSGPSFAGLSSATAATGGATLTWSAATGTAPLTYNVYEATSSGGENFASLTLTTNSLSAFISSLSCTSTYYFVVRAVDGCGNIDTNEIERSVQPLGTPPAFGGLSNVTAAVDAATLSWSAASGLSPITYSVFAATSSGAENYGSPVLTTNALSALVTSLSCSNTYYFVVRATSGCGIGESNSVQHSVQPLVAPIGFAGLASVTAAADGATLSWAAASGESPIAYNVFQGTSSGGENFGSPVLTTSSLSAFIPSLSCTNTYYFVVRAVGGCGSGDNNAVEQSVQPLPAPLVFSGLTGITAATEAATLTWPSASGVPPFIYNVYEATTSGGENLASPTLTTNSLSAFIAPLYPGSNSPITYFFIVRAQGGCNSSESNTVERSIQPLLDPNKSQVGDGIPNGWKEQYGFNPFDPTVAAADPDGDGMSNLQEYLAGTDPTNSASYFHITSATPVGYDTLVTWTCGGGRTNAVQSATDLTMGFSDISTGIILSGTGDVVTNYLDLGGVTNNPNQYYRIRLVP